MSDEQAVMAELDALTGDAVISDACARVIASQWHSGQWSPLYALQSSGAITDGAAAEVSDAGASTSVPAEQAALRELGRYIDHHGARGPVDGWSSLWP